MKKIKYIALFLVLMLISVKVSAANTINKISMDIYIDSEGTANITEVWDANFTKDTEAYHSYHRLGKSTITDFTVSDDSGRVYEYNENWNIKASFNEKKYTNGLYPTNGGYDLCWGISNYGKRTYTINYKITNFVFNTADGYQVLIWELISKEMSPKPKNVYIRVYSDERFSDNLDVWGYGNKGGTAYVYDGYIEMQPPEKGLGSDDYMTLLVKFPPNYFNTTYTLDKSWDKVFEDAEKGSSKYSQFWDKFWGFLVIVIEMVVFIGIPILIAIFTKNHGSKIKNKVYPKKDVLPFRDLPFKDDYLLAYLICDEYGLNKQKTDLLGSMLLKWIKDGNVNVTTEAKGIFKTKSTKIELKKAPTEKMELEMYEMMKIAAKDEILEKNEFKIYCQRHYKSILNWFDRVLSNEYSIISQNKEYIDKVMTKTAFGQKEVIGATDKLNEKASYMAGLKKFFKEFTSMHDKQAIEVKMWRDYLIYAQLFGMAKEVAKEFKDLYPDVISDDMYNDIILINTFSYDSVNAASVARSRAESYSAGGGGFSSGGGGGGSFGGGGGGTR